MKSAVLVVLAVLVVVLVAMPTAAQTVVTPVPHKVTLKCVASSTAGAQHQFYSATTSAGPFIPLTSAPVPTCNYVDDLGITMNGKSKFYLVRATLKDPNTGQWIESKDSNIAKADIPADPIVPDPDTDLTVTVGPGQ